MLSLFDMFERKKMADGMFDKLNVIEKVVAVVSAAALGFTTFSANNIENKVSVQKMQLDEVSRRQELDLQARKESRDSVRQGNELTKTIFDEFVKAITDQATPIPQRIDRLEGVLVLTYAIPDPRQQEGMGRAVMSAMDRIRLPESSFEGPRLAAAKFDAEELVTRARNEQRKEDAPAPAVEGKQVTWSNYDFDVFYCDGIDNSEKLKAEAASVINLKALDAKASGRWRVRPLPMEVNARPGYRVSGNEIRYSSSDEKPLADLLQKNMTDKKLNIPGVQVRATSQQTRWYISVFLCSAG
ncbi:MAG: hypothetical protein JSR69_05805 [Proteobacteria bacterium]|nr:hypothetical protein [Pseudomonadota bacterium]